MKTSLLLILFSTFFFSNVNAQVLEYRDHHIYKNDTLLYTVIEMSSGRPLLDRDYLVSDSSQYYDYLIVDTNNTQILNLVANNNTVPSDAHYPNRFASHSIRVSNYPHSIFFGTITENHLTVIADNTTYRNYLIDYLISFGLLTADGVNRSLITEFREYHR